MYIASKKIICISFSSYDHKYHFYLCEAFELKNKRVKLPASCSPIEDQASLTLWEQALSC